MHLFGRTTSVNVQKVLWTLEELGIPYQQTDLGGEFGGLGAPDYAAKNPNQRVPTLVDGDLTLWESNAIVRYLSSAYGNGKFAGATPVARAKADMWMEWFQNNCYAHFIALFYQAVRLPVAERDAQEKERAIMALTKSYEILNAHLEHNLFVAGDRVSMGDFVIGAPLFRYFTMDIDRVELPALVRYYQRLSTRGSYEKTIMTSYDSLRAKGPA